MSGLRSYAGSDPVLCRVTGSDTATATERERARARAAEVAFPDFQGQSRRRTPPPRQRGRRPTAEERFRAKVRPEGEHRVFYGRLARFHGRDVPPTRVSWALEFGPIPEGMVVRHTCPVENCVAPDHLALSHRRNGDPYARRVTTCTCGGEVLALGLCSACYQRQWRRRRKTG